MPRNKAKMRGADAPDPASTASASTADRDPFERLHTKPGFAYSRLVLEILQAQARLAAAGDGLAREFELSAARWLVMGAIRESGRSISEIARDRGLTRQSVQEIVGDMERQGLVTLIEDPSDRRAKLVRLTPRGSSLFLALTERWAERANRLACSFTKQELDAARKVIERLRLALE